MNKIKPSFLVLSLFLCLRLTGCVAGGHLATIRSADEYYARGTDFLHRKKNISAITEFQGVVYNYPGDARVDSAQYFLAMAYFNDRNFPLATVEFDRLLASYPSSPLAEASQYMKAASLFEGSPKSPNLDQTDLQKAVRQLSDFLTDNPESPYVPEAQKYLSRGNDRLAARLFAGGMVYYKIHAYDAAGKYFQRVIDDYTSTPYAPRASYHLAEVAFAAGKYQKAIDLFTTFTKAFPDHLLAVRANQRIPQARAKLARLPVSAVKDSANTPQAALEKPAPDSSK